MAIPKPKLLYITTIPLTQWAFLEGQNRYMAERGFELHAISSPGPELAALAERDGVIIHPVPMSRRISPLRDILSLMALVIKIRQIKPDILHVSTPKAALLGSIAGWLTRVPCRVFLVRGLLTERGDGPSRHVFQRLERLTARLCHRSICVSDSLLSFGIQEQILDPRKSVVLASGMSNGINPMRFRRDDELMAGLPERIPQTFAETDLVIGFVGRLAYDKGIEELAEAWSHIRMEFPHTHLLLVGPWEEEHPIRSAVRVKLERDDRVHITGFVGDVVPYYQAMSLFVFPSHGTEGFPNAPMEAASMALPVIATCVVGCMDAVIDGVTGTLISAHDPEELAAAMRAYLTAPEMRDSHGKAGRERVVREFNQTRIWEALYQEYCGLLGLPPTASNVSTQAANAIQ